MSQPGGEGVCIFLMVHTAQIAETLMQRVTQQAGQGGAKIRQQVESGGGSKERNVVAV